MNTRQVRVLKIMIIMVNHVHIDVELHGRSHVTFYYTLCYFVDLVVFLRLFIASLDLGLYYVMMIT